MRRAMPLVASLLFFAGLLVLGGCDVTDPGTEPDPPVDNEPPPDVAPPRLPDATLGRVAFVEECASCHANTDGFDLAFFDFSDADIIRRGVAHVDTVTAQDIAAFIRSLDVTPVGRRFRPFQPGGQAVLPGDWVFWEQLFGTGGWPAHLTAEALRAVDPREVAVSLALPVWSSENDESDWMPEHPLPDEVLGADGGVVQRALDEYLATPTMDGLVAVLAQFRSVTADTTRSAAPLCRGEASTHTYPLACFEARRWMSALAGLHLLREPEGTPVPFEIAQVWWDTGEAAVSHFFLTEGTPLTRLDVARWLYLGFIFAPEAFPERNGYLGQFLTSSSLERLATFAMLRRMVGEGRAHQDNFAQHYWDAVLATNRAPRDLVFDVAAFSYGFLIDRVEAGVFPVDRAEASSFVQLAWDLMEQRGVDMTSTQADDVAALRDQLLALLEEQ